MNRLPTLAKGLGAALLLMLILVGVPVVLVRVGALPSSVPDPASLWRAATGPDPSGRAVFAVLAALVWLAWATFTLSVLRESAAAIRSHGLRPARSLPGLDWSARPAAALIGAIVTMLVAAPVLTAAAPHAAAAAHHPPTAGADRHAPIVATATRHPGPAADQTNPSPADNDPVHAAANQPPAPAVPDSPGVSEDPTPGQVRYTVKRRDTLWSIAEKHLGDPLRYRDIAALNPHLGADYQIHSGQVLTLPTPQQATPTDPASQQAVQVSVRKGDTLCGIAREHGIGDWHIVWAANAGKAEPGGKHFTNPDHIEVGWHLTVPVTQPNPPTTAPIASASGSPTPSPPHQAPRRWSAPHRPQRADTAPRRRSGPPRQPTTRLPRPRRPNPPPRPPSVLRRQLRPRPPPGVAQRRRATSMLVFSRLSNRRAGSLPEVGCWPPACWRRWRWPAGSGCGTAGPVAPWLLPARAWFRWSAPA